jgi:hypothetical protein
VEKLRSTGDINLHFVDGFKLLSDEYSSECTVDGIHPTDLGFMGMAKALEPIFRELLKDVK